VGLKEFVAKRIVTGFITLILIIIANFILFRLPSFISGVDPVELYGIALLQSGATGGGSNPIDIVFRIIAFRKRWGLPSLNAPVGVWMDHFFKYFINMLTFNFGESYLTPKGDVATLLIVRFPITLAYTIPATLLSLFIGIYIGVRIGAKPGSKLDITFMTIAMIMISIPTFWLQILFKYAFVWGTGLWPVTGGTSSYPLVYDPLLGVVDLIYMMTLPIVTLVMTGFPGWMILMRNSLIDVMSEDYIITARAKGLDEETVLYKHAFRNAILPVVTSIVLSLALVWTGAIITETIFNISGVGQLYWLSITSFNYPVMEMLFYFMALSIVFANIIADVSYALLDPRVQY